MLSLKKKAQANDHDTYETEHKRKIERIMDFLADLYPNFLIALSGHSNGAQVIYDTLINLPENTRANAWEHFLIRTYGGIQLIPEDFGVDVRNIVSEKDYAAKYYIDRDLSDPKYPVKLVPCLSSSSQCVLKFIDHSFMSPTYRFYSNQENTNFGKRYDYIYKHIR